MLLWVLLLLVTTPLCKAEDVKIGLLVPWLGSAWPEGPKAASAAVLAINDINNDPNLLANYTLKYEWKDDGCNRRDALGNLTYLWANWKADVFIGPSCSTSCEPTGELAAVWNLPMISWACTSPALSDPAMYPTFARTVGPYNTLGTPFFALMKHYKWYRCAIITSNQNLYSLSARQIQQELTQLYVSDDKEDCKYSSKGDCQIDVVMYRTFFSGQEPGANISMEADRQEIMTEIKNTARIIFILGYTDDIRDIMLRALDMEMLNGYAWIGIDLLAAGYKSSEGWMNNPERDEDARTAFQGVLSYTLAVNESARYKKFATDVRDTIAKEPFNYVMKATESVSVFAQNLYDAVYMYAYGLQDMLNENPAADKRDGAGLMNYMVNNKFTALGRTVIINEVGDRLSDYILQNFNGTHFVEIGSYTSAKNDSISINNGTWAWPGGATDVPNPCGQSGVICSEQHDSPDKIVIAVVAVLIVLAIICVSIFVWRRHEQSERDKKLWIIPSVDVQFVGTKFRSSLSIDQDAESHKSTFSMMSNGDYGAGAGNKAIYKAQLVSITRLTKSQVNITPAIIKEFKTVRELSHSNINPILGACPETNNIFIVNGMCGKGTVLDVLSNHKIHLDDMFKSSMINDTAKALEYLHKSVLQCHGNMTSQSLGIDSHWVLKISDYGLQEFRAGCNNAADAGEDHKYWLQLWRSPELLDTPIGQGTQKGDIYAFAIIINEILMRETPYESHDLSPKEICEKVAKQMSPPFRPDFKAPESPQGGQLQQLVHQMWQDNPPLRPDIGNIRKKLKEIYPEKTRSITDRVIKMMEKYTDQLEVLVEEKTAELTLEKQKADELLYKMLPRPVAEKLKQGNPIMAEWFDSVTIYFSDVVSFTNLCAGSSPMEVVAFLNDMYTAFDDCTDDYDVYKVETIGDAYMLVSGLPNRNGDKHVVEITETSLALIEAVKRFKVRHRPGYQLKIRIGIHTGPVCAGVVGLKMPRYCLFGDTVNTSSRMESNGEAMRIHCSEPTWDILNTYDCYDFEKRTPMEIKGKGLMDTYFCNGLKPGGKRPQLVKGMPSKPQPATIEDLGPMPDAPESPKNLNKRAPPKGFKNHKSSPSFSNHSSPELDPHPAKEPLLKNEVKSPKSDVIRSLDRLQDSAV